MSGLATRIGIGALTGGPVGGFFAAAWAFLTAIPWQVWAAIAAALLLWRASVWHEHKVADAFTRGGDVQLAADKATVTRAFIKANDQARAAATKREAKQSTITGKVGHETDDALAHLRRDYAAYRLRHAAGTAQGGTVGGDQGALPGSAAGALGQAEPEDVAVAAPLSLIQEGDEYRQQVLGWQEWFERQRALDAADR